MNLMLSRVCVLVLVLTIALWGGPQQPATKSPQKAAPQTAAASVPAGEKSARNKQHLEGYLRHLYMWSPQIKVEIGDFTPSPVPGLMQTTVRASYGAASDQLTLYIT